MYSSPARIHHRHFHYMEYAAADDSAKRAFAKFAEIPDTTPLRHLALPVVKNQVWAVKTQKNKYAKILLSRTLAKIGSSNLAGPTPCTEATFKWVYQPDGSRQFCRINYFQKTPEIERQSHLPTAKVKPAKFRGWEILENLTERWRLRKRSYEIFFAVLVIKPSIFYLDV
ncbi:MAG: hypothetical protein P8184_19985 [Calditrichia bacterium]